MTDGVFLRALPSQQLLQKRVNGRRILTGNNADEGYDFTPRDIVAESDFQDYVIDLFPSFSTTDYQKIFRYYSTPNASSNPEAQRFATNGLTPPVAVNQSFIATGQQQRAINLFSEVTITCPSYWLAEAFSNGNITQAWKYQYSVIPAFHARDITGYFGSPTKVPNQSSDFILAFMRIWANFITFGSPTSNSSRSTATPSQEALINWMEYDITSAAMLNLNQSGGTIVQQQVQEGLEVSVPVDPGLENDFSIVDAYAWEGGRGTRCDFWREVGSLIPL